MRLPDFKSDAARVPVAPATGASRARPGVAPDPERAGPLKTLEPAKREVARLPGYMRPDDFLAMFRYVREKAYESKSFRDFVKSLPS